MTDELKSKEEQIEFLVSEFTKERDTLENKLKVLVPQWKELYKKEKALDVKITDNETIKAMVPHFSENHTEIEVHHKYGSNYIFCKQCEALNKNDPLQRSHEFRLRGTFSTQLLAEKNVKQFHDDVYKKEAKIVRARFNEKYKKPSVYIERIYFR